MATKRTDDQAQAGTELDSSNTVATAQITQAVPTTALAPASAPAPQTSNGPALDDFHGQGGEYEIVNGVRRLVSRTEVIDPTRAPDVEVNPARAPSNA